MLNLSLHTEVEEQFYLISLPTKSIDILAYIILQTRWIVGYSLNLKNSQRYTKELRRVYSLNGLMIICLTIIKNYNLASQIFHYVSFSEKLLKYSK